MYALIESGYGVKKAKCSPPLSKLPESKSEAPGKTRATRGGTGRSGAARPKTAPMTARREDMLNLKDMLHEHLTRKSEASRAGEGMHKYGARPKFGLVRPRTVLNHAAELDHNFPPLCGDADQTEETGSARRWGGQRFESLRVSTGR